MTTLHDIPVALPASPAEAVAAFGDGSGVTVIAGGTITVPEINAGRLRPARVVLLGRAGLDGFSREGGMVRIGAACQLSALEAAPDPLAAAAREVGDQEIRAQATLGGNLCAPPADDVQRGDLRAPLIALAARVRSAGAGGERTEPVEDFLAAASTRLILEVEFEEPRWAGYASLHRAHAHHYTVLAVSAAETSAGLRIAVTGAGGAGLRLRAAEASGNPADAVGEDALGGVEFGDDALASAWYRRRMLPVLVARALASRSS